MQTMRKSDPLPLCLIEDDAIMGESLVDRFTIEGFDVDWFKNATDALARFAQRSYVIAISDIRLPDLAGEELFARLAQTQRPLPPFIFITAFGSIETAVRLLKMGANDYIAKPFDLDHLVDKVRSLCQPLAPSETPEPAPTLGISAAMRAIKATLPRLAQHGASVLITGESGVGKEHVARALHTALVDHAQRPFIAINCAALTETLLEAELFGYEKGAFTGALRTKKGVFEQAHGGTLFLDEIGEMPSVMQAKLLRAIQERRITRVGGETSITVDLRLICATNRNLREMVEKGAFREDLYYRINVVQLKVPPLRERKEDILWFADQFLRELAVKHPADKKSLTPAAEHALLDCPWPGNIRELRHTIERACIFSKEPILHAHDLFEELVPGAAAGDSEELEQYLHACERAYIVRALEKHNWQIGATAGSLGISRKNLWEKMKKLDIHAKP